MKFNILIDNPDGYNHYADNKIKSEDITMYLGNLQCRKNVSTKTLARKINYYYLCELICIYGQMHQNDLIYKPYHKKGFLRRCRRGFWESKCRVTRVLTLINIFR